MTAIGSGADGPLLARSNAQADGRLTAQFQAFGRELPLARLAQFATKEV